MKLLQAYMNVILNPFDVKTIFLKLSCKKGVVVLFSCHSQKEISRFKISRFKRLRQGQYGIHNVNTQWDWPSDGTSWRGRGGDKSYTDNHTVFWSCVCSAGAVYFILTLHVILDVPGKVLYFLQAIKPTYCTAWLGTIFTWQRLW